MILRTCAIWSLFHLDTGTPISDPGEFYPSTNSSMDWQWWVTLVGRWLKCHVVLIIIIALY